MQMKLAGKYTDLLNEIIRVEGGVPDLEIEEPGKKKGTAEVFDELADLVILDRDKALVAAVLAVLLLEDDAGDAPGLALLGGDALARVGPRDRQYGLSVLGVGAREGVRFLVGEKGGCSRRLGVATEEEGLGQYGATEEKHG